MSKLGSLFGMVILLAGAYGVYTLFHAPPTADEEEEAATATLVPVEVGMLERATLHGYILAYGTVSLDPGDAETPPAIVQVTAPADGLIAEAHCTVGQEVAEGELLFRLDNRMLEVAVEKARQTVGFAEKDFARQQKLQKIDGTSDKMYLEAQQRLEEARADLTAAETQLGLLSVTAPFAGTIAAVNAAAGASVSLAQPLAELHDNSRTIVAAGVASGEAGVLALGQHVDINLAGAHEAEPLQGTLTYIAPEVDPATDTLPIRISLPPGTSLRPGTFLEARILYDVKENCLVVDKEGVVTTPEGKSQIAVVEGNMAKIVPVATGLREGDLVEVMGEGLEAGMTVVTVGAYGLPEETQVRILNR